MIAALAAIEFYQLCSKHHHHVYPVSLTIRLTINQAWLTWCKDIVVLVVTSLLMMLKTSPRLAVSTRNRLAWPWLHLLSKTTTKMFYLEDCVDFNDGMIILLLLFCFNSLGSVTFTAEITITSGTDSQTRIYTASTLQILYEAVFTIYNQPSNASSFTVNNRKSKLAFQLH